MYRYIKALRYPANETEREPWYRLECLAAVRFQGMRWPDLVNLCPPMVRSCLGITKVDIGADVVAVRDDAQILVQCKHTKRHGVNLASVTKMASLSNRLHADTHVFHLGRSHPELCTAHARHDFDAYNMRVVVTPDVDAELDRLVNISTEIKDTDNLVTVCNEIWIVLLPLLILRDQTKKW